MDGDGQPEAAGIDISRTEEEGGVHRYGDGADDRGAGGGDVEEDEDNGEDQDGEITSEPFFGDAEEDADDENFGDGGIDEGVPEGGQQGQKGSGCGDGKDVGQILDEDDCGCNTGAEEDAGDQVLRKFRGRKFGYLSFFVSLVEEDVDGADQESEHSAGDRVLFGQGQGGLAQELLHAQHGGEADAEAKGNADRDAGEGEVEDGLASDGHAVLFKCMGFFDILGT